MDAIDADSGSMCGRNETDDVIFVILVIVVVGVVVVVVVNRNNDDDDDDDGGGIGVVGIENAVTPVDFNCSSCT